MKIALKYSFIFVFLFIAILSVFLVSNSAFASSHNTYTPISPIVTGNQTVDLDAPESYIIQTFTIFIVVISILAVIKLIICGFTYMMSESITSKGSARECIGAVMTGLFLILLSWLILYVINPDLTKVDFFANTKVQIKQGLDKINTGSQQPTQPVPPVPCPNTSYTDCNSAVIVNISSGSTISNTWFPQGNSRVVPIKPKTTSCSAIANITIDGEPYKYSNSVNSCAVRGFTDHACCVYIK